MVTYGEIYDDEIKSLKITYSDGYDEKKTITGDGNIFVHNPSEQKGVASLEGFDSQGNRIYLFPEDF
jgi:hypothetical protein